jgi:uridine kinase
LLEYKKKISKGTIIILEGSIALSFSNLLPNEARKCFFLTIDESLRKNRFFETYKSRGLEDFDIEKLYLDRITDENEFIMKTQRYADWCLDSVDWV